MENCRVSHLPLIQDNQYMGLISDKDIYDLELEMCQLHENLTSLPTPSVYVNQHIYEVTQKILELKLSLIPVLEMNNDFCGVISMNNLAPIIANLFMTKESGAIIVLEVSPIDYSLSQISQIIESNDVKILSLYTQNPEDSREMNVSLKVNVTDISSVIQTFVRYNYNIKAVYMDDSLLHDMYSDRYELFMKYLNI